MHRTAAAQASAGSGDGSKITGQTINVNGGWYMS
jgi:hypothetical protein